MIRPSIKHAETHAKIVELVGEIDWEAVIECVFNWGAQWELDSQLKQLKELVEAE